MIQKFLALWKPKRKKRSIKIDHHGEWYNLKEIYDQLNTRYFDQKLDLRIQWFGYKKSRARSSIRLGSYNQRTKVIKINRLLDQPHIPPYFVSFIIYHEMLHDLLPPIKGKNGRRRVHHKEFLLREREYEEYLQAQAFMTTLKHHHFQRKTGNTLSLIKR